MLGAQFIEFIGAIVRWLFGGMKKPFKEIWLSVEGDDIYKSFADSIINKVIGFIFFFGLIMLLLYIEEKYFR